MQTLAQVSALRHQLWQAGLRPVPVQNPVLGDKLSGKAPLGKAWQIEARRDPPGCLDRAVAFALNTGVLCDGLRAIDLDIDDPALAAQCVQLALDMLPAGAPVRYRAGSPRCLMVWRAADGEPSKVVLAGTGGKIEVLGRGQQFVAYGEHWEGAELQWRGELTGELPAVAERDVYAFLAACAPLLGAVAPRYTNGADHPAEPGEPQADPLRIAAALRDIPNDGPPDWEAWNRVCMAVWAAAGGAGVGWELLAAWSARNRAYDPAATRARWDHYRTSPPTAIGAGTIFRAAQRARAGLLDPFGPDDDQRKRPDWQPHGDPRDDVPPAGETQAEPSPIPFTTFADVHAAADVADFIEGLLIMGAMSVIYGAPNCGKSFLALDMALHVAAKPDWRGQALDRGAVLYLALEGSTGSINNRIYAIKQREGWTYQDIPLAVIGVSVDLRHADAHVEPLIATVAAVTERFAAAECPVRWIIVDTLSRAMAGGNENASEDMGALVLCCDRVRRATGCHLSLVHHSGKDEAKGARGHSILLGATDTELEVFDDNGTRTVTVTKQRDLPPLPAFAFQLRQVDIGTNRRGKPITSCVVEYEGQPTARPRSGPGARKRGEPTHADRALEILADLCAAEGRAGYAGCPAGVASVPAAWWRERFYDRAMPGEEPDTKKHAYARATKQLIGTHHVGMAGDRVWIARPEDYEK